MVAIPKIEPRYWTYADAAAAVRVSRRTLERHVAEGRLAVLRLGRSVRLRPSDVLAWFERYGTDSGPK